MSATENTPNGFWLKITGSLLTLAIVGIISITYEMSIQVAVIKSDVTYVKEMLKNFHSRLDTIEKDD